MIDASGYRLNIGIILTNRLGQVFWAKRIGRRVWQFPQGGMHENETPEQTLYRELLEEVGLEQTDVTVLGRTRNWLRYRIPQRLIRNTQPVCIGQKQLWYLLRLEADERAIRFDLCGKPEFDDWQWSSYWYPLRKVVLFKREVYRKALRELAPYLFKNTPRSWGVRPLNFLIN